MDAEDAKKAQLVEAVVEFDRVQAAGLIDEAGNLRRVNGHARVFRSGEPVDGDASSADGGHEDVYLESAGDEYLVVVFGVDEEFEPIKAKIDELIEKLDL